MRVDKAWAKAGIVIDALLKRGYYPEFWYDGKKVYGGFVDKRDKKQWKYFKVHKEDVPEAVMAAAKLVVEDFVENKRKNGE